ncbi:MAG TPA: hypothetical protein VFV99_22385 [Kofleriaceae bacterium]|nr:hypothetical protein [Kofleriaceae bacterium]
MTPSVRGFVVATKCETIEELVEKYAPRSDDQSIFVGIVEERVLGAECAFAILLADKQPAFAGICQVLEVFRDDNNPYQRRGMRLGIRKLGITSERLFADMAAMRANKRRFARGSTAPPEADLDGVPIVVDDADDEMSDSIPIDLEDELSGPARARS